MYKNFYFSTWKWPSNGRNIIVFNVNFLLKSVSKNLLIRIFFCSNFPIMQIKPLKMSSVVQVQWCDTKLRISPPVMKQCYWNLAGMLHPTKYTRWYTLWCCYGNMLGSSPFPLKIKYYQLYECRCTGQNMQLEMLKKKLNEGGTGVRLR